MMKLATLALFPVAVSLAACGGSSSNPSNKPISDKEGAANATYRVQNTNDDVRAKGGQGLSPAQIDIPGGGETKVTVQGQSGTAEVTVKSVVGEGGVMAELTVKYIGYSSDGVNILDGEVTQTANVGGGEGTAEVSTSVKGTLDLRGEIESHLVMDVTTSVSVSGSSASVKIDGAVTADGTTYQYNGDTFNFSRVAF